MTGLRWWQPITLVFALAVVLPQTARAQDRRVPSPISPARGERICAIYALADLGSDRAFGEWIAETIPQVIEPESWKGQGVLRYHAARQVLVVYHTRAVQDRVESFLKELKKTPFGDKAAARSASVGDPAVVSAGYRLPARTAAAAPVPARDLGYPVPAQATRPKHLFHFIIRYEGDGIVDDNVVKLMKAQYQAATKDAVTAGAVVGGSPLGAAIGAVVPIRTVQATPPQALPAAAPGCPAPSVMAVPCIPPVAAPQYPPPVAAPQYAPPPATPPPPATTAPQAETPAKKVKVKN